MPPLKLFHRLISRPIDTSLLAPPGPSAPLPADQLEVTWLGVAGVALELDGRRLLLDPFFTRPGPATTIALPLIPDKEAIRRHAPRGIDFIVCSHAHYDHILDVPTLAMQSGARVVGSTSTCNYCRASGMPEAQLIEVKTPAHLELGPFEVTLLPSRHVDPPLVIPRAVGLIPPDVRPPLGGLKFRNDQTAAVQVEVRTAGRGKPLSLMHLGSASFLPETFAGRRCDLLLAGILSHHRTPGFTARVLSSLKPRVVIPIHIDDFLLPLEQGLHVLNSAGLEAFLGEVEQADATCETVVLDLMGRYRLT